MSCAAPFFIENPIQRIFAARAAADMTGMALAIGEGLPSDQVVKLAKAGFAEMERNRRGGLKTGKRSEDEAAEMWQPHALEIAKRIQAKGILHNSNSPTK